MWGVLLLAILAGTLMGYFLERGNFCFHSTMRGLFRMPRQKDLMKAYFLLLLIATPLVQGMKALGWISPWVPPFAWQANLLGGFLFGIGMVIASTCVTGMFYKLGHGMLGVLVALAAWALGDMLIYIGPLAPIRESLNVAQVSVDGQSATVLNLLGLVGAVMVSAVVGLAMFSFMLQKGDKDRRPYWNWVRLGVVLGIFIPVSWLMAKAGASDYPFGTSGVPTSIYQWLVNGQTISPWIPVSLLALVLGALIAAIHAKTLWVRGEGWTRYLELGGGGFVMGVAAGISGGCNLGHSLIGVPLLSLGSITATLAMFAGVFLAHSATQMWARAQTEQSVAGSAH
jgi:hypothetical protein